MNEIQQGVTQAMAGFGIPPAARIAVGVSGGMDSMVLLHVLHSLGWNVTATHVNFRLRGKESDAEAVFVRQYCDEHHIPFQVLESDTRKFAEEHQLNTQSAARQIRYDWWTELHDQGHFDFVATAHHEEDQIETLLINFLRGTGMKGLKGIPAQRQFFIRPMLAISKARIETYALEHDLPFRTDSSNLKDDYLRNRIRHKVIPLLQHIIPGFHARMRKNINRIQLEWKAWDQAFRNWEKQSIQPEMEGWNLQVQAGDEAFLLRWLELKGIPWNLAHDYVFAPAPSGGTTLSYESFTLSRTDQGYFFEKTHVPFEVSIPEAGLYETDHLVFSIEEVSPEAFRTGLDPSMQFISSDAVHFPLTWRSIRAGDAFQPIGMGGRHKKIQDLLVDRKLNPHEKDKVSILASEGQILWVVGIQLDERAKVKPEEKKLYAIRIRQKGRG